MLFGLVRLGKVGLGMISSFTALIPDNCCDSCMTMAMMRGSLSVGDEIWNKKS
jgi:hypothetical protein